MISDRSVLDPVANSTRIFEGTYSKFLVGRSLYLKAKHNLLASIVPNLDRKSC